MGTLIHALEKRLKEGDRNIVPTRPKRNGHQGFGHMKQDCLTYLKSIGKSKALAATFSDMEP